MPAVPSRSGTFKVGYLFPVPFRNLLVHAVEFPSDLENLAVPFDKFRREVAWWLLSWISDR